MDPEEIEQQTEETAPPEESRESAYYTEDIEEEEEQGVEQEQTEEAPEGEAAPEGEETPETPAYTPPAYTPRQGETNGEKFLRENYGAEVVSAFREMYQADIAEAQQATVAASAFSAQAATQHPELFKVHGAKINQTLAAMPPTQRASQSGLNLAIMGVAYEESLTTGDLPGAIKRLNDLMNKAAARSESAPRKTIPPSQRPPQPRGGGVPSTADSAPRGAAGADFLAKRFGIRPGAARAIYDDEQE